MESRGDSILISPNPYTMEDPISDKFIDTMINMMFDAEWTLEKETSDFKVYSRVNSNTKLKSFKLETEMNATIDAVLDLLHYQLVERHKEWNETYVDGRVINTRDKDSNLQYWSYKFSSSLIKPRDFVVNHRMVRNDKRVVLIEADATHSSAPETPKYVRCSLPYNVRHITFLPDGKLKFIYMNLTDIKGMIPMWLANKLNPDVSLKEMQLIKNICEKDSKHSSM